MADKLLPFRREFTGTVTGDRMQRTAQQAAQKVNGIVGNFVMKGAAIESLTANVTTASATMADVAGLSISIAAQPGDILIFDAALPGTISAGAGLGYLMWAVVDGTATNTIAAQAIYSNVVAVTAPMTGLWVVQNKGTVTVKVQGQTTAASTLTLYGNASGSGLRGSLRLQQMRAVA